MIYRWLLGGYWEVTGRLLGSYWEVTVRLLKCVCLEVQGQYSSVPPAISRITPCRPQQHIARTWPCSMCTVTSQDALHTNHFAQACPLLTHDPLKYVSVHFAHPRQSCPHTCSVSTMFACTCAFLVRLARCTCSVRTVLACMCAFLLRNVRCTQQVLQGTVHGRKDQTDSETSRETSGRQIVERKRLLIRMRAIWVSWLPPPRPQLNVEEARQGGDNFFSVQVKQPALHATQQH